MYKVTTLSFQCCVSPAAALAVFLLGHPAVFLSFSIVLLLSNQLWLFFQTILFYDFSRYPKSCLLDHTWVAHRWILDLGLPQYQSQFESNLVDGRILNILSKKDMEKHLSIHRKFHQVSVLHGVELLRRLSFDKEVCWIAFFWAICFGYSIILLQLLLASQSRLIWRFFSSSHLILVMAYHQDKQTRHIYIYLYRIQDW